MVADELEWGEAKGTRESPEAGLAASAAKKKGGVNLQPD